MFEETYRLVTYDEVEEAKKRKEEAVRNYTSKHKDYLFTCLCNAGFLGVRVRAKETKVVGVLRVAENHGSLLYPYEIKFYPVKKDGNISLNSRGVPKFWGWQLKTMPEMLRELFEIAGDDNAS